MSVYTDQLHRTALLLLERGDVETIEEADIRLAGLTMHIRVGTDIQANYADQVALLSLVVLGVRTFLGGVYVEGNLNVPNLIRAIPVENLAQAVGYLGANLITTPAANSFTVYVANAKETSRGVRLVYSGWCGGIVPAQSAFQEQPRNSALTAVLAAALAINEVFEHKSSRRKDAGLRAALLSLWDLHTGADCFSRLEPQIKRLPNAIWLLGLGHLGQAYAWLLSMMNYPYPDAVNLILQDVDHVGESTISTSVLSRKEDIGKRKTRVVASWLYEAGFDPRIIDQLFTGNQLLQSGDPQLCFVGVDNIQARHALADSEFQTIIEAGLGRDAQTFSRINIHVLPGKHKPEQIWQLPTEGSDSGKGDRFSDLAKQKKLDPCGQTELANIAVGAPFVGMTAACLVYAQALRLLHQGPYFDSVDITVEAINYNRSSQMTTLCQARNLGYQSI